MRKSEMHPCRFSLLFISLILVTLLSSQCVNNCSKVVQFEIPLSIYPQLESYNLYDTLWVELILTPLLEDEFTMELLNVGSHNFQVDMNILELLDTNWIDGTHNVQIIPSIGDIEIRGITYPEVVPQLVQFENENIQKWKFGIVFLESDKDLVLLFGKRDPNGWGGEFFFPESDCIYGISSSYFLTNGGNIDYDYYVEKFPYFKESGNGPNIAENHKMSGAFFIHVE